MNCHKNIFAPTFPKSLLTTFLIAIFSLFGFVQPENAPKSGATQSAVDGRPFASLTAVLVVGPQEDGTLAAEKSMDEIADLLIGHGVTVHRFYAENADWEKIKIVAKSANFFIYSGHGSTLGEGGKTGGLCLKTMVSSKKMMEDLQLKDNAMVIFKSVCRGAGSSASDDGDIGIQEALVRVSDYAKPFFQTGASCYYANNIGNGCQSFLADFFSGKTIQECFEISARSWAKIEFSKPYVFDSKKVISIASTEWEGTTTRTTYTNGVKTVEEFPSTKNYDIAYVANPGFTIKDMTQ